MLNNGRTDTSYNEAALQGNQRPQDQRSIADAIEHIGREDTPLLSKIKTGKGAGQNKHEWLFRKVAEADRKPVAAVSGFTGGTKPSTQRLDNATEIFKHEDWISKSAKDTKTYGTSEEALMHKDLVTKHKKSQEHAILGINRKVITDGGDGAYNYASLDADPVIAARMSLIAAPIFRSGDGTKPEDASQMAGIFHYLANTGLSQGDINSGKFRDLTDWNNGFLGQIQAFDSTKNWEGNKTLIDRKHISGLIRRLTDYGVPTSDGAFDLYAGGDLVETIGDMYGEKRRMDMKDKEIGYMVETIITQFGKARIHYHREFNEANGLNDVLLCGNFNFLEKNFLSSTEKTNPSTDKTADLFRYYSDLTMSVRNAFAFTGAIGLKAA